MIAQSGVIISGVAGGGVRLVRFLNAAQAKPLEEENVMGDGVGVVISGSGLALVHLGDADLEHLEEGVGVVIGNGSMEVGVGFVRLADIDDQLDPEQAQNADALVLCGGVDLIRTRNDIDGVVRIEEGAGVVVSESSIAVSRLRDLNLEQIEEGFGVFIGAGGKVGCVRLQEEDVVGGRMMDFEFGFMAKFKPDSAFSCYDKRVRSFSGMEGATALARAGFYRTADEKTRCFCCELDVDGRLESPFYRHAPDCLYMKHFFNCLTMVKPFNNRYAFEEARLKSFAQWPRALKQRPSELAAAGFFYTGQGDKVECYHCALGLNHWESDDEPWPEHARWAEKCFHVLMLKGAAYVQQVVSDKCLVRERKKVYQEGGEEVLGAADEAEVPFERCRFCLSADRDRCFMPCGHVVACGGCTLKFTHCPMCRCRIVKVHQLYY